MLSEIEIRRGPIQKPGPIEGFTQGLVDRVSMWREALKDRRTFVLLLPRQPHLVDTITEKALHFIPNPRGMDLAAIPPLVRFADEEYRALRGVAATEARLNQNVEVNDAELQKVEESGLKTHYTIETKSGTVKVFIEDALDIARIAFLIPDRDELKRIGGIAGLDYVVSAAMEHKVHSFRHFTHLVVNNEQRPMYDSDGYPLVPYAYLPDTFVAGQTLRFIDGDDIEQRARVLPPESDKPMPRLVLFGQKTIIKDGEGTVIEEIDPDLGAIFGEALDRDRRVLVITKPGHFDVTLATLREQGYANGEGRFRIITRTDRRQVTSVDGEPPPITTNIIQSREEGDNRIDLVIETRSGDGDEYVNYVNKKIGDGSPIFHDMVAAVGVDITQTGGSLDTLKQAKIRELMKSPAVALNFANRLSSNGYHR